MGRKEKYVLSFTAASLRLNEMVRAATYARENGITDLKKIADKSVVFGTINSRTSEREFSELRNRIEKLTPEQVDVLIKGDLLSQKQIGFLAVCKHYGFIRDFTIDVIRDKALVFDYQINESDFNSFLNNRVLHHPELETFSESTLKKAKQVMFRILDQAGIINNAVDKIILPQLLQQDVTKSILMDEPKWLKVFLMPDYDIDNLRH